VVQQERNDMIDIVGKEWFDIVGDEFEKDYMSKLAATVLNDRKKYTVYPKNTKQIFSVFKKLQPSKIKVVILGQDPYHDGSYNGMAFSNNKKKLSISPSLRNILKEVESDIHDGLALDQDPDLTRWQKQGVFLLNKVLTVKKGKPNSHAGIGWETFTQTCIEALSSHRENLVFMLWGAKAREIIPYIHGDSHLILEAGHPSPMSANMGRWFDNRHFSRCNRFLNERGIDRITW